MNPNEHEEWQAMKIQWKSTSVAEMLMTQQLRWGLRLRMIGSWAWLGLEVAALLLITVLGIIQIAMGQAAVGSLYIVLALVGVGASWWTRRQRFVAGARGIVAAPRAARHPHGLGELLHDRRIHRLGAGAVLVRHRRRAGGIP
jgi:hypothetical protein